MQEVGLEPNLVDNYDIAGITVDTYADTSGVGMIRIPSRTVKAAIGLISPCVTATLPAEEAQRFNEFYEEVVATGSVGGDNWQMTSADSCFRTDLRVNRTGDNKRFPYMIVISGNRNAPLSSNCLDWLRQQNFLPQTKTK